MGRIVCCDGDPQHLSRPGPGCVAMPYIFRPPGATFFNPRLQSGSPPAVQMGVQRWELATKRRKCDQRIPFWFSWTVWPCAYKLVILTYVRHLTRIYQKLKSWAETSYRTKGPAGSASSGAQYCNPEKSGQGGPVGGSAAGPALGIPPSDAPDGSASSSLIRPHSGLLILPGPVRLEWPRRTAHANRCTPGLACPSLPWPSISEVTGGVARTFNIYTGRLDLLRCELPTAGEEQRSRGCKKMILVRLQGHAEDSAPAPL